MDLFNITYALWIVCILLAVIYFIKGRSSADSED